MIARVPVRIRLALAFGLAMALLLVGLGLFLRVSLATVLDEEFDRSLTTRSDDVAALVVDAGPGLAEGPTTETEDGFVQIIGPDGEVVDVSSARLAAPVLDPDQLAQARSGALTTDIGPVADVTSDSRVLARPVDAPGGEIVGASLEERDEAVGGLTRLLAIGIPIALILAAVGGYLLAAAAFRPVEAIRRRAAEISGRERGARVPLSPAPDELRRLGETLNGMLERVDASLERERAFVADASHELRTPLSILKAELEFALAGDRSYAELHAALMSASKETDRLVRLAEGLLVIARSERGALALRRESVPTGDLLRRVTERTDARARTAGRAIKIHGGGPALVEVDRLRIEQALGNHVDNALRHGAGRVELAAEPRDGGTTLIVRDEGRGVPPELGDRAFDRFTHGEGIEVDRVAGLGLAIVRAIVGAHGGTARAVETDSGTAVELWLPDGGATNPA
jgi:two-component system OmpR family sensor kinase